MLKYKIQITSKYGKSMQPWCFMYINIVFIAILFLNTSKGASFEEIIKSLTVSDEDLTKLVHSMENEFEKGLGKDTNPNAEIQMHPTYVTATPDGTGKCVVSFSKKSVFPKKKLLFA